MTTTKKKTKQEDNSMRGYKTLANGKKTSYFHKELTEEGKGDNMGEREYLLIV